MAAEETQGDDLELRHRRSLLQLRASERRLELLVEKCQELICEVDHEGKLSYITANAEELLGYRPEELLGRGVRELVEILQGDGSGFEVGPEDLASLTRSGPHGALRRFRHRNGEERWLDVRAVVFREPAGQLRGLAVIRDVTDHMRHESELRASEERYRTLFENAFDIIAELDSEGRVIYVNESVETILGWSAEQAVGMPLLAAIGEEHQADVKSRLADGTPERLDGTSRVRVVNRRGKPHWLEFTLRSFTSANGDSHRVLIAHDITERVQIEQSIETQHAELERRVEERTESLRAANSKLRLLQQGLLEAERLGAGEELAGAVAHSINNPLQALIGTLELAMESDQDLRSSIDRGLRLAKRVRDVVDRSLGLFRRDALQREPQSASALLALVDLEFRDRARESGVEIKLDSAAGLPLVDVDQTLLVAALVSLAENALEAMPEGGTLELRADSPMGPQFVRFTVEDTGSGIPDGLLERVTQPFFTTKGGGTGLGLAIAKNIVTAHQGRLLLKRRPGGGTAAFIELRAVAAAAQP